jgi:starvation-inducible DNA-binding protein
LGSLKDFTAITRLSEHNHDFTDTSHIIKTLLEDHEAIIRSLRKDIQVAAEQHRDLGTADFMTGIMEQHEKMSWMLRAHVA